MKFIITESKMENIIFKYLDNQDFVKVDVNRGFELLNSEDDDVVQIYYDYKYKTCYIYPELNNEIRDFFSFEEGDKQPSIIISKWFKNKFGVVISKIDTDTIFIR